MNVNYMDRIFYIPFTVYRQFIIYQMIHNVLMYFFVLPVWQAIQIFHRIRFSYFVSRYITLNVQAF